MRITQSISLSNIQTFLKKARPKAMGNLPDYRPVSKSAPPCGDGDQETANEVVELIGIEPMTPCLQSRCSPN